MATQDDMIRMLQSQLAQWQADAAAQMGKLQANMQATFDQKLAELTRVADGGDERRDRRDDHSLFDAKHFRLCKVFDGSSTGLKWEEWQYDFLRAVSARSAACGKAMEDLLKEAGATRDITTIQIDPLVKQYGSQLFNVICGLTTGEANLIVRSANDKGAGWCGFAAMCLLSRRFIPKTLARVLQSLTVVLSLPAVQDIRLLG